MTRFVLVGVLCFFPLSVFAALETPGKRGINALVAFCGDSSVVSDLVPAAQKKVRFFDVLEPKISERGEVKTFSVKAQKDNSEKDAGNERFNCSTGHAVSNNASLKPFKGSFIMPISGEITSRFGYRVHPFRKVRHFHTGVDIRARRGTPIIAAAEGRVVYAGWKRGYGLMIEVEHGDSFRSVYAHCSKLCVRAGSTVRAGEKIALVGNTGVTTGPHLHFEIMRGSKLVNPLSFFYRA